MSNSENCLPVSSAIQPQVPVNYDGPPLKTISFDPVQLDNVDIRRRGSYTWIFCRSQHITKPWADVSSQRRNNYGLPSPPPPHKPDVNGIEPTSAGKGGKGTNPILIRHCSGNLHTIILEPKTGIFKDWVNQQPANFRNHTRLITYWGRVLKTVIEIESIGVVCPPLPIIRRSLGPLPI